ncbi:MAG: transketolase [bacterium]
MVSNEIVEHIEKMALKIRLDILEMIGIGKVGHLGGSSSCADIVATLYFYKMKFDPNNLKWEYRDRFLLSKGHAALAQYAALAELGIIPREELKKLKTLGAMLQGHPDMRKTPGIEANTGSLGQGLSIAVGMALGLKLDRKESKVYVIVGDGELAEGQIWEAVMAASNYKLDNLIAFIDNNGLQATGPIKDRFNIYPIVPKWEAFGWYVKEIDGHNIREIIEALEDIDNIREKPKVIIAKTVKGKGFSFAENNPAFHNGALTEEQFLQAKKELKALLISR